MGEQGEFGSGKRVSRSNQNNHQNKYNSFLAQSREHQWELDRVWKICACVYVFFLQTTVHLMFSDWNEQKVVEC